MSRPTDQNAQKSRKPWTKPTIRKIELTEEERAALLASKDPMALLGMIKPNLQ